jgi:hypothetical protein
MRIFFLQPCHLFRRIDLMKVKQPNPATRLVVGPSRNDEFGARVETGESRSGFFSTIKTYLNPIDPTMKSNPNKKPLRTPFAVVLLALGAMLVTSCTTREKATFWGGVGGAASGALFSGDGNRLRGALIGGAVGAGAGNLLARHSY